MGNYYKLGVFTLAEGRNDNDKISQNLGYNPWAYTIL